MYAFVYLKPISSVSVTSGSIPALFPDATFPLDTLHQSGIQSTISAGNRAPGTCALALFSTRTEIKVHSSTQGSRRYIPTPCQPFRVSKHGRRCLTQQVSRGLPAIPNRHALVSPQRQVRAAALPPLMWAEIPETGSTRDFLFAAIGAGCALLMSAAAAWAWHKEEMKLRAAAAERGLAAAFPEPNGNSGQKESVEWVNMVIQKIWKIYRRSLEAWLVGLLQPAIDKLPKPDYVKRVEIAEFSLNRSPISVRNVQRRASRRANDLQYHIGLRYTGGAQCLLVLHLVKGGVNTVIPVGVHDLDVDAEMWVKLRLSPRKPYVGTLSIAFVRLPTIKLVLAPFRILNLFSVPFLSSFLSKLLTVDLPRLLVLPRHITFDFLPDHEDAASLTVGSSRSTVLDLLKAEPLSELSGPTEPGDVFVGELTVTLCEARNLGTWNVAGLSNPYCQLSLGDHVQESKKNEETSHPAGPADPVWNQDFQFWVEDPIHQKLTVRVRDNRFTLNPTIGFVEIPVWQLRDCVPVSVWSPLLKEGPWGVSKALGEVRLMLTYKSYVDAEWEGGLGGVKFPYIKVFSEEETESDEEMKEEGGGEVVVGGREGLMEERGEEGERNVERKKLEEVVGGAVAGLRHLLPPPPPPSSPPQLEGGGEKEEWFKGSVGAKKWVGDQAGTAGKWVVNVTGEAGGWVGRQAGGLWDRWRSGGKDGEGSGRKEVAESEMPRVEIEVSNESLTHPAGRHGDGDGGEDGDRKVEVGEGHAESPRERAIAELVDWVSRRK